jgi:hypothetical protein
MIKISQPKFVKTFRYLNRAKRLDPLDILHEYGKMGVAALRNATPMDTGETAYAWDYTVKGDRNRYVLSWTNSVMAGGVPLVILLQYGHATKAGYYLSGRDFINPALKPIYDGIEKALMNEVFK